MSSGWLWDWMWVRGSFAFGLGWVGLDWAGSPAGCLPDLELISNAESVFSRETVASWTASERGLWKKYKRLMEDGDAALKRSEASQAAKLYVEGQRTMETLRGRIGEAAA